MKRSANLKCNVCGCKYSPEARHYIARDNMETSLASAFSGAVEADIYDAFDCPVCGCQKIVQKRKRALILSKSNNSDICEDDEAKEEESDE